MSVFAKIEGEPDSSTIVRRDLLKKIGAAFEGRTVVSYYTSFIHEVEISDEDVTILEDVIMHAKLDDGLLLIISSPGGSGLAAERIVNVCRQYSNSNFEVVVPKQAKSAATMICLGAKAIHMSPTSELGPIDPQFRQRLADGAVGFLPADIIVSSYEELMEDAVNTPGKVEPYLQQLARYDRRYVAVMKRESDLGEGMAAQILKTGMMSALSLPKIKAKIKPFTDASMLGSHGRPIFLDQASKCGLNIKPIDLSSAMWRDIMELHVRSNLVVSQAVCKMIESERHSFVAPVGELQ